MKTLSNRGNKMGIISKIKSIFGFGKEAQERKAIEQAIAKKRKAIKQAKDIKVYIEASAKQLKEDYEKNPLKFYLMPQDTLLLDHIVDLPRMALDFRLPEQDFYSNEQLKMLYELEREKEFEFYMLITIILAILSLAFLYGAYA